MKKIMLVDSDIKYSEIIKDFLKNQSYQVETFQDSGEAYWRLREERFDLLICDLEFETISGLQLIQLAKLNFKLPTIVLTHEDNTEKEHEAFVSGCMDYIKKDTDVLIIQKRIERAVAFSETSQTEFSRCISGEITVDLKTRTVYENEASIYLTYTEYEMLKLMMSHPMEAFSREQIIEWIWNSANETYSRSVDTHILSIRKKLKFHKIESIRGYGYRWAYPVERII